MKAYVIDQDELKQYIFIAIIALLLSFSFGYIVGDGQDADSQRIPEKAIDSADTDLSSPLAMKKDTKVSADKVENKIVQKDLKKSKPEKKKEIKKKEVKKKPQAKKQIAAKKTSSKKSESKPAITQKKKPVVQKKTVDKDKKSTVAKSKPEEATAKAASADKKLSEKQASTSPPVSAVGQDKIDNKRSYSIQAGMFASKNNAESFIEKLAVENFEAYVSDFVSTSGAVKYNVRVGRFEERNKARERLKEYQKYFSTPAYVVISQ